MEIILKFNQISDRLARDCVKKHKNASFETIKEVYPNAKLSTVFGDEKTKFFSVAFSMDNKHNHCQEHLQGMLRIASSVDIGIKINGTLPEKKLYDSYRFYAGIDEYNEAICILAFAKRQKITGSKSNHYKDVEGYYYAYHCEINDPDMHSGSHPLNHLSCNPNCEGTSLS